MTTVNQTDSTIDNKVKQVISNIRNLPTPPVVFHQIQKVINDPMVSADRIAAILSEDPAMSVKVLKLTNSAFYGLAREIESVKQAVVIVGMEAIKNLVLSASVLDMFKGKDADHEFQEEFWRHSLATAFCSRILARKLRARGMVDPDSAFSAGLLHDIGKMIMACYLPKENQAFREARDKDRVSPDFEVEDQAIGFTHAQVGAVLAVQWKLPQKISQAITYHHHPQLSEADTPIAEVVHIANYVAKLTFYNKVDTWKIGALAEGIADHMQFDDAAIEGFCDDLRGEYTKAETFMKMAGLS